MRSVRCGEERSGEGEGAGDQETIVLNGLDCLPIECLTGDCDLERDWRCCAGDK